MALGTNALQVVIDESGGAVRVTALGELDMFTAVELAEVVHAARGGRDRLRLDLGRLDFIDSVGLTLLVRLRLQAGRQGWTLELVRPPAHVWRFVEVAGLAGDLPWADAS